MCIYVQTSDWQPKSDVALTFHINQTTGPGFYPYKSNSQLHTSTTAGLILNKMKTFAHYVSINPIW